MANGWDKFPWSTLIKKIKNGYCTPFIGAGASYPAVPVAKELADLLLAEYAKQENAKPCPLADRSDLARVVQFLSIRAEDPLTPKIDTAALIEGMTPPDFDDPTEPHRLLAELHLPLYITTNYDDFMASALRRVQSRPVTGDTRILEVHQDYCRWTEKLLRENTSIFDDRQFKLDGAHPVVFHLHGHINRHNDPSGRGAVEAIVVTEDDYLDFLVNISQDLTAFGPMRATKPQMLPLPVRTALTGTTLLFIGYSLADVNFRVILRALRRTLQNSNEPLNVAIQYAGDNPRELQEYLEEYFRRTLTLSVFWSTARDFSKELRTRWEAYLHPPPSINTH